MAGGKGRTLSAAVLNGSLDGVAFTTQTAANIRFALGTGTPNTGTCLLSAYNTNLGLQAMDSVAGWTTTSEGGSALGSNTTNDTQIQWTNSSGGNLAVTELGIMRSASSPNTAAQLLYSVGFTVVNVGDGGTITINASGLTVTER